MTYQDEEICNLRGALDIALDSLMEQEKKQGAWDTDARRILARTIDDLATSMINNAEKINRDTEG